MDDMQMADKVWSALKNHTMTNRRKVIDFVIHECGAKVTDMSYTSSGLGVLYEFKDGSMLSGFYGKGDTMAHHLGDAADSPHL